MIEGDREPGEWLGPKGLPVPWTVRDILHGLGLLAVGGAVVVGVMLSLGERDEARQASVAVPLALAAMPALMMAACWLFGVRRRRVSWTNLGIAKPDPPGSLWLALPALVLSLTAAAIYAAVLMAAGLDDLLPSPIPSGALGEGAYRAINVLNVGLVGPFAEEVFFRGFLMAAAVRRLGTIRGAAVGSAVFSLSHLSLGVLVPFFVSGLLLSWLYLKTRSVWPPFAAHAAQNLIALAALSASAR